MCSKSIRMAIFVFSLVLDSVQSKLIQAHVVFRHGEKAIDTDVMYPTDPYKNHSFAPYGAAQLTNEGKRSMYSLYDELLGDLYVPNIIDSWSSSYQRCQTSLLTVLASLFPPKGPLVWNENLNWQPIPYQFVPIERDDLFMGIKTKDFVKEYNQYYFNEGRKKLPEGTDVILSYVQAHSNSTIRTLHDLMYFYLVISAEESYGLILPEWTRKVYPQPINDLILLEFSLQLGTKRLRRKLVGKLMMKILKDSDNRIRNHSSYKLHLYAGHDATIVWILMLLGLMYNHHPNFAACLIVELHEENGGHFFEKSYDFALPERTKKVYAQSISDLILLEYSFHTAARNFERKISVFVEKGAISTIATVLTRILEAVLQNELCRAFIHFLIAVTSVLKQEEIILSKTNI